MYIIFDVDDTLYDLMFPFVEAHKEVFGVEGDQALEALPEIELKGMPRFESGGMPWSESGGMPFKKKLEWLFQRSRYHSDVAFYRWSQGEINKEEEFRYRVVMTYKDIGLEVDAELADHFRDRYRYYQEHIVPFPGIMSLLGKLSAAGVKLGILTNGKHKGQMGKIMALGVNEVIPESRIFISEDLPAPKPDIRAFQAMEEALGIQKEEIWYIGDNYDVDIIGAKGAGWKSIWFNHREKTVGNQKVEPVGGQKAESTGGQEANALGGQKAESVADLEVRSVEDLEKALLRLFYQGNHFYSLNQYLKNQFGEKVYKIALDGGMTCPNRDGKLDTRGCIFCSSGGSGEFAQKLETTITTQIEAAKARIRKKTDARKFIAYFQSYTNTYAPAEYLRKLFTEAISHPEVAVLSIGTRPDCLPEEVLDLLEELNQIKPVWVELGLQTIHEETARYIRRGYELPVYEAAVEALHARGIQVITHVILGLPGESQEMMLETVKYLAGHVALCTDGNCIKSGKRTDGIKLQLLHVLEGTDLAAEYEAGKFKVMTMDAYFDVLLKALTLLPPDMVIHRLTGDGAKKLLIAPQWSANKKLVLNELNRRIRDEGVYQGLFF